MFLRDNVWCLLIWLSLGCAWGGDVSDAGGAEEPSADQSESVADESAEPEISFCYTGADVADHVVVINYQQGDVKGACCGVVVLMDGVPYLVTMQSALWGSGRLSFQTVSGRVIQPQRIEVAEDSNLMRLALAEGDGLLLASMFDEGDEVAVFGKNSDVDDVSALYGRIKGIGGDAVEISAAFDREHLGAPVLDKEGHLVAVANAVRESGTNRVLKGTRFANQTRRFCCRLERTRWVAVPWGQLNRQYGSVYAENAQMIEGLNDLLEVISEEPLGAIELDGSPGKELASWMELHNRVVHRSPGEGSSRRKFYSDYAASAKKLASMCRSQARKAELVAGMRGLTPFMLSEMEGQVQALNNYAEVIEYVGAQTYDD
jgi:hypothetical protein